MTTFRNKANSLDYKNKMKESFDKVKNKKVNIFNKI